MSHERPDTKLSLHAKNALEAADRIARAAGGKIILPRHLLSAILLEEGAFGTLFLRNAGVDGVLRDDFAPERKKGGEPVSRSRRGSGLGFSPDTKTILTQAYFIASDFRSPYVGTEHLAYSLLENPGAELGRIFAASGIDTEKTLDALESHLEPDHLPSIGRMLDLPDFSLAGPDTEQRSDTPALSQYATDLAVESKRRDERFFGRDEETERLIRILGRREKSNPILLGDPGVGKTAIVSALARRIESGDAPVALAGQRILALDLAGIVAGTSFRGEFEARIRDIVAEAKEHPEIILFVDELHTIVGAGNTQGGLDAANILKPALARGEIRVIGATTTEEYKKHIERDPALSRRFQPIRVRELPPEETRTLLRHISPSYERFHGVAVPKDLIDLAVSLADRHLPERFFPDKAIDILDEASSLAKSRRAGSRAGREAVTLDTALRNLAEKKAALIRDGRFDEAVSLLDDEMRLRAERETLRRKPVSDRTTAPVTLTRRDVLETVSSLSGIPFASLETETPTERLRRLGERLRASVTHQEEAVSRVEDALVRAAGGVRDPQKPLGSFLFLGPSGVGKTLLAETVARDFFGGDDRLIRLDMSEFMERHSVARMIGAPAGYVGFGEGGRLTERIRKTPHAVVLFDEVEKAHPDVWNLLLQILDEGALTDAEGVRVSFRNTLIILTSNLGSESFRRGGAIGFSDSASTTVSDDVRRAVLEEVRKTLRPELIARIGHTAVFSPLGPSAMDRIVRIELDRLKRRLLERGIRLSAPETVVRFLTRRSFSETEGARLVGRHVEEFVGLPIARLLVGRDIDPDATDTRLSIRLSVSDDRIICSIPEAAKKGTKKRRVRKAVRHEQ